MKHRIALPLFALGLLAASQPVLAATSKADARATAALVAALQAVSPDPLGGRLGLDVSTTRTPPLPATKPGNRFVTQSNRAELDRRTYLVWKSSQKS